MKEMRNPANWSDPPSADHVARAIVAACREVGADPLDVANGVTRRGGNDKVPPVSRARSYAAKALAVVFTSYPRTRLAGMVGCKGLVRQSYFSALDQRLRSPAGKPWWDEAILARVVEAIGRMPDSQSQIALPKIGSPAEPFKAMPYRPPVGTYEKTLAADAEDDDDGPAFDRGSFGGIRRRPDRPVASKAQMEADLWEAVQRTAAMQKPED